MELEIKGWGGGGVPRKEAGMGVSGALSKGDTSQRTPPAPPGKQVEILGP